MTALVLVGEKRNPHLFDQISNIFNVVWRLWKQISKYGDEIHNKTSSAKSYIFIPGGGFIKMLFIIIINKVGLNTDP